MEFEEYAYKICPYGTYNRYQRIKRDDWVYKYINTTDTVRNEMKNETRGRNPKNYR